MCSLCLDGEAVRLPIRMVVAPETGTFRSRPPEVCTTEGELVAPGVALGSVERLDESIEVTSAFRGFLMGMLAVPGERVRRGQPVAWLHHTGTA